MALSLSILTLSSTAALLRRPLA